MSCCEYRWYDGHVLAPAVGGPTVKTWKIEYATADGRMGGWFLFHSKWDISNWPLSSGDHDHERPWNSKLEQRLRQITGGCGESVSYTATQVTVTPASTETL